MDELLDAIVAQDGSAVEIAFGNVATDSADVIAKGGRAQNMTATRVKGTKIPWPRPERPSGENRHWEGRTTTRESSFFSLNR